ncbi:MAG TPA: glycosyltransferase family 39 protein [Rhizomicrobium sp.]|jgi:4-amino-4-deoxy-L-arabinose transferase-like glycosyltransferase
MIAEVSSERSRLGILGREPEILLWLFLAFQLVVWTLLPWALATSLPLDVVSDGLAWGHEWQLGYYKHPPLPSWMVEAFFDVLGDLGPFLLSQIAVTATCALVYLLGRSMMAARWAAVGTVMLAGVYYFSIPTPEFNHNVAQMPFWAAASLAYFRALQSGRLRWWLALGAVAGLGLLCKYSTALLLVAIVLHAAASHKGRKALLTWKPYAAIALCLVVLSPHLAWLDRHDFPTLHYAVGRAGHADTIGGRIVAPFKFLLAQLIDVAPALIVGAIIGLRPRRPDDSSSAENTNFLLWLVLGPPLLSCLLALATGLGLRDMWGAPMWNLTGLLLVESARPGWQKDGLKRLPVCVAVLFVIGLASYVVFKEIGPDLENRPPRTQWPDRAMAAQFADAFEQTTHRPLRIVAADGWIGGLVAMRLEPRASVWIDASGAKAPWVTPDAVRRDGVLVLWRAGADDAPPPTLSGLPGLKTMGTKTFSWPKTPGAAPLRIGYGIVPPGDAP